MSGFFGNDMAAGHRPYRAATEINPVQWRQYHNNHSLVRITERNRIGLPWQLIAEHDDCSDLTDDDTRIYLTKKEPLKVVRLTAAAGARPRSVRLAAQGRASAFIAA